jgi:hypothetical protein
VDATGRRRRQQYAELADRLGVRLEVGALPVTAHLVDFTYERVIVGMAKSQAPSLARGMIARVTVDVLAETTSCVYECTSEGCFELDDQLHLAFKVQGGVRLDEVPPSVGRVLNQRRTLRIRPPSGTQLRVAVRRSEGVQPIAGEVVDISRDGLKIILPTSLRRFSTWGVHLDLAIRLCKDDPALRMSGRVRSCGATPDGRVAVGISLDADASVTFDASQRQLARWVAAHDPRQLRERGGVENPAVEADAGGGAASAQG